MTKAKHDTDFELTLDTPYLALTGKVWGVYREYFGENWPRYNGTALYFASLIEKTGYPLQHGPHYVLSSLLIKYMYMMQGQSLRIYLIIVK